MPTNPTSRSTSAASAAAVMLFVRNCEAMSQAAQTLINGTLAASGQQMESLRALSEQSMKSFIAVLTETNPKEAVRKSFDAVRSSMQNATAVSNIFSEIS